jgi:SAM-dependent methyltransferase
MRDPGAWAGNGYFAPLLLRRFSGQIPARLVISDQSRAQLDIAQSALGVDGAEYLPLDVQEAFRLAYGGCDLILAIMLFNELPTGRPQFALRECRRVLAANGRLIAAVPHPAFVRALAKKGVLTDFGRGLFAMPSAEGLRLPVSRRPLEAYIEALSSLRGYSRAKAAARPDQRLMPMLISLGGTPVAGVPNSQPFLNRLSLLAQEAADILAH